LGIASTFLWLTEKPYFVPFSIHSPHPGFCLASRFRQINLHNYRRTKCSRYLSVLQVFRSAPRLASGSRNFQPFSHTELAECDRLQSFTRQ
jgi:hypothetical protein